MGMRALGRLFDIGLGFAPTDMNTNNGETGKRISMKNASGLTILVIKAAGTAAEDPTFTLKQHTAYTSGTTSDLVGATTYHYKAETALDNDESWVEKTQTTAATIADPGGLGTSAETQMLIAIYVGADMLSDGYTHVSLDYAVTASNAQLATWIYILHDLQVQRKPANLGNLLNPGAANA